MTVRARLLSATLLVMYVVFLAAVMTGPGRVEFLLNAAMFAPVALMAALTFPRHPWASWVVYAFVASAAVELFQGVYLPPRSAQFVDVVANTLGGLVGVVISVPFRQFLTAAPGQHGAGG